VPAARSMHPSRVADDPQVTRALTTVHHPWKGRFVQVAPPLHLSSDAPAVSGPAPQPGPRP
jgi:crotonobetainyl-CoA:carnitine CoA-transferase CaiB-like acyl-CoA transferase